MQVMGPELLGRLLDEHAAALVLHARQWCAAPEDVVQEAFVKLAGQGVSPERVVACLYRVVRNGAISAGRAARRRRRHELKAAARECEWFVPSPEARLTTFLVPRGEQAMFLDRRGLRIADVTDGTAYTIMVVDADDLHAVVWTRPEDLTVDLKNPARGLATRFEPKYLTAFVDGSVHFLPKTMSANVLGALFTPQGGEVVNLP